MTTIALAARTGDSAWTSSDVAWRSPGDDAIAVFAGHGGQGMGSSLAHHVARTLGPPPPSSARERAAWVLRRAHEAAVAGFDPAFGTFGTMACVAWDDGGVAIAHAGDSRVYRVRVDQRVIECLTRDHVAGDTEPLNRMLVNGVGGREDVRIDERAITAASGDVLVCCTPRVWHSLGDELRMILTSHSLDDAPARIVHRVAEIDPGGGSAVALVAYSPP